MGIVKDVHDAADWVAAALVASGYRADFSPPSLWEIERFFETEAPGGRPRTGGLLADDLGTRIFAVGAYLGEVIRRQVGGDWSGDDSDPSAEVHATLTLPNGAVVWPVQRVMKRFSNGSEDSTVVYGMALGLEVGPAPKRPRRWFRR
ncbi:hypothetical protein [Actinoplanes awajinensis]|uniref:hypothetical protein n=1 Tax=Actinoplanes awajinensis TaxID=135946 RepID=UPI0012F70ABB|nr:hypothetical protein [Actinoplanes awajinensis]